MRRFWLRLRYWRLRWRRPLHSDHRPRRMYTMNIQRRRPWSRPGSATQHRIVCLGPLDPALFQLTSLEIPLDVLVGELGFSGATGFVCFSLPVSHASVPVGVGTEPAPLGFVPFADVAFGPRVIPLVDGCHRRYG
jgi:hypothetical protein